MKQCVESPLQSVWHMENVFVFSLFFSYHHGTFHLSLVFLIIPLLGKQARFNILSDLLYISFENRFQTCLPFFSGFSIHLN